MTCLVVTGSEYRRILVGFDNGCVNVYDAESFFRIINICSVKKEFNVNDAFTSHKSEKHEKQIELFDKQ